MRWIQELRSDLGFALRYFARNKATSAIVIAVLALGIGANTIIFSAMQAEMLRPAPAVPDDDRLVRLWSTQRDNPTAKWNERDLTGPELAALAERGELFESVAAAHSHDVVLVGPDSAGPQGVRAQFVTPNYFATVGIPLTGPGLARDASGGDLSVVLSHTMAEQFYQTAAAAVGQRLLVNDRVVRVAGVAPPRFQGARRNSQRPALWIPIDSRAELARVSPRWMEDEASLELFARLRTSASRDQATAAARDVVARHLPDSAARVGLARNAQVLDLEQIAPGPESYELIFTITAISLIGLLILLVTCTNVSSLMVAAATGRRHEIAVRLSLGASRARVVRQLLTETTLLTMTGGALGVLLTWWGYIWLDRTRAVQGVDVRVDFGTLVFMLLVAAGTGIVFGLSPALHATGGRFAGALRDSGAGATKSSRLQRVFVTAQIVLSQPLLVMIGVMLSLGIQEYSPMPRDVSERLVRVAFRPLAQSGGQAHRTEAVEQLIPRIAQRAEVHSVLPEAAGYALKYVNVRSSKGTDSLALLRVMGTQPGLFEQRDVRLLLGRDVTLADTNAADAPVVIGSQLARRLWGETSPIGRVLLSPRSAEADVDTSRLVVVGVFEQPAAMGVDDMIRAYTAHEARWRRDAIVIRTRGPAEPYLPELRRVIRDLAPGLPVMEMKTQAQRDADERLIALKISLLAAAAAALALLLASLGLYGVVSLAVRQRTREIGIRIAVGAAPARVARMFLVSGVRIGVVALLLGLPVCVIGLHFALSTNALIAPELNPWHIGAGITLILLAVVAVASWIPARRAATVDPATTLRVD
jgi:putative ABC transport system permease protein